MRNPGSDHKTRELCRLPSRYSADDVSTPNRALPTVIKTVMAMTRPRMDAGTPNTYMRLVRCSVSTDVGLLMLRPPDLSHRQLRQRGLVAKRARRLRNCHARWRRALGPGSRGPPRWRARPGGGFEGPLRRAPNFGRRRGARTEIGRA